MSSVYFLRAGDDGPVKIGFARDLNLRITDIQIGCPEPVALLRVIDDGGKAAERWLHSHFKEQRLRGEWFSFSDDMLTIEVPNEALDVGSSMKTAYEEATIDLDAMIISQKSCLENQLNYELRQSECCLLWAKDCVAYAKAETNKTIALAIADRGEEFLKLAERWASKIKEIPNRRDPVDAPPLPDLEGVEVAEAEPHD
jgi:hypothetical protein